MRLNRFIEVLKETMKESLIIKGETERGDPMIMLKDPTESQLRALWVRSGEDLRGIVEGDHVYWTPSVGAVHGDMAHTLGLKNYDIESRMYLNSFTEQGRTIGMKLHLSDSLLNRIPKISSMGWMLTSTHIFIIHQGEILTMAEFSSKWFEAGHESPVKLSSAQQDMRKY